MRTKGNRVPDPEEFRQANAAAAAYGAEIAKNFSRLSRRQRVSLVNTFRRQLLPPRRPGRRRSKKITAAHADWRAGIRGVALYERHIPGFRKMGYWKRKDKIRNLMDVIRKRERRKTKPKTSPPEKTSR